MFQPCALCLRRFTNQLQNDITFIKLDFVVANRDWRDANSGQTKQIIPVLYNNNIVDCCIPSNDPKYTRRTLNK